MRLSSKTRVVTVLAIVLLMSSAPAEAACNFTCTQGYDYANCWEWLSGSLGNMATCSEVCDCNGFSCSCWCSGIGCYNV
jgi:hypothetical protein